jgi:ankyrin repeat protein
MTPLQLASNLGWVEGVEILAEKGASTDLANSAGETPLISAVHRRDLALIRVLLEAGADPDRSDNSGRSARDYAALLGPQSSIMAELDKAREDRKARAARSYGPGG